MLDSATERRLAAIVAVDLAGYSARTEADEAGAVRAVEALSRNVERAAAAHGGRVFSAAGDGFMLEFPTVSGALAAAEEISRRADPPVRAGVHLGEVTVTAKADLLGHGVNVAARLQALAQPGAVLVSEAARRALGGGAADRLKPQGKVRLDKMNETAAVFVLATPGAAPKRGLQRRLGRLLPAALAAVVLLAAGIGGYAWWSASRPPAELRVAVSPFQARGAETAVTALADEVTRGVGSALTERQAPTVTPGAGADAARLVVGGEAEREGDILRVRVRLDDRQDGVALWTQSYERPVAEADALGAQVAAKVADMVAVAIRSLGPRAGRIDSETLAAFIRLSDLQRGGRFKSPMSLEIERQIVAKAPDFSLGYSSLADDLAVLANEQSPAVAKQMRREARQAVDKALQLDPHNGYAYSALMRLAPSDQPWEYFKILDKGLRAQPDNPDLTNYMADVLRVSGRMRESEPYYRRALLLDPFSPSKTATHIFALAGTGALKESEAMADRGLRLFPNYPTVATGAAYTAILYGAPERALWAVGQALRFGAIKEDEAALWRDYVNSTRRGRNDPAVLKRLADAAQNGRIEASAIAAALSIAGDLDGAFAAAEVGVRGEARFYPSTLFEGATANMRRDPRFMPLAERMGAVELWRRTGKWPDFCGEPGLPYDCKAVAEKLAAARPRR